MPRMEGFPRLEGRSSLTRPFPAPEKGILVGVRNVLSGAMKAGSVGVSDDVGVFVYVRKCTYLGLIYLAEDGEQQVPHRAFSPIRNDKTSVNSTESLANS